MPPGLKLENTYLPYQNGPKYTTPNIEEAKKTETKRVKYIPDEFKEDEEPVQPKKVDKAKNPSPSTSNFNFIAKNPKPDVPSFSVPPVSNNHAVSPPKKEE